MLGGYELVERIGSGGMGIVYRAIDRRMNTTVAVKVIHEHLQADSAFVERFRDEAHYASLLTSPYIVRVIEFGFDQGQYFIATEFIEGTKLSQLIAQRQLSTEDSVAIAVQVAMALQAAAAHSVVHRDVKPDNIVITKDNAVKLMDFGVARLSYVETRQLFLGTVAYAAPEQFRGQTTIQSDIYAVGVVLFQMLAGELPFKGDTLSSLIRMHDEVAPPLEKIDWAPPDLVEIIARCLQKDPTLRYKDPSELLMALRRVQRNLTNPGDTMIADPTAVSAATITAQTVTSAAPRPVPSKAPPAAGAPPPRAVQPQLAPGRRGAPSRMVLAGGGAVLAAILLGGAMMVFGSGGGKPQNGSMAVAEEPPPTLEAPAAAPTEAPPPPPPPTEVPPPPPPPAPPAAAPAAPAAPPVVAPPVVRPTNTPAPPPPPPPPPPAATPAPPPPPPAPGGQYSLAGFSDRTAADNSLPGGAAGSGGTVYSCSPSSLYAFVNFSNVQAPKQFSGLWLRDGVSLGNNEFTQTQASGQSFFQIRSSFTALTPGRYTFQLRVDGAVVTQGSFTLAC
jgi:serine/threonine-protein kinase